MELNEFLQDESAEEENEIAELDIQKAVVEEFAAEKAEMSVQISELRKENYRQKTEISHLQEEIDTLKATLIRIGDDLVKNIESPTSNQVALLDRNQELDDHFKGETRDHVLEVLKEAMIKAEEEGRLRRARLLEAVLAANEPSGELAKHRTAIEKLFQENANLISGPVMEELDKQGISYKVGDNYLLMPEIMKREF